MILKKKHEMRQTYKNQLQLHKKMVVDVALSGAIPGKSRE